MLAICSASIGYSAQYARDAFLEMLTMFGSFVSAAASADWLPPVTCKRERWPSALEIEDGSLDGSLDPLADNRRIKALLQTDAERLMEIAMILILNTDQNSDTDLATHFYPVDSM